MTGATVGLTGFDALDPAAARELVRGACASDQWAGTVVDGRPYGSLPALLAASTDAVSRLRWASVEQALAAHPRIGDRPTGSDRESAWSREEQSAADPSEALRRGNVEYERRFGHVFLICAAGLSSERILAALSQRLAHDRATEQEVVRRELAAIVSLRLAKVLG